MAEIADIAETTGAMPVREGHQFDEASLSRWMSASRPARTKAGVSLIPVRADAVATRSSSSVTVVRMATSHHV